jgi:hypothetical protein
MTSRHLIASWSAGFLVTVARAAAQVPAPAPTADDDPARIKNAADHYPVLVTAKTLANPEAFKELRTPGRIIFSDDFEKPDALKAAFEVLGMKEGRVKLATDAAIAHSGSGALQLTTPANDGKSIGAGPSYWFGSEKDGGGHDRVYLRYYIKFAPDYDQGNLNHTGASLAAVSGTSMWDGMGRAGIRPKGDDRFTSGFEPWRDYGRNPPPGAMHLYTYWMDMRKDKDGNFWGNMMMPEGADRINPERGRWYCFEQMIKANTPGAPEDKPDGELAAWIDGKLYMHYTGFRWRTAAAVKLKRFALSIYIHQSTRENTVWYDDVVLSTGYVGLMAVVDGKLGVSREKDGKSK